MKALNWTRIILCGYVAGVVFALLSYVLIGGFGGEFLTAVGSRASVDGGSAKTDPILYFVTISAGVWAVWLYAIVRPQTSSNAGAVVTVSIAWWIIASAQSLKWILLLGIPLNAWLPLAANLVPIAIAVFVGSALLGHSHTQ